MRIRTDVSATLFISAPEDYDGGELMVEDTYGSHAVKLPAGDMIVYPGDQPAPRHADHARLAHRLVLLDAEPDPRRDAARAAVRSRHGDHRGSTARSPRASVASFRSRRSITTCCGNGPRCEAPDERRRADAASDDRIP